MAPEGWINLDGSWQVGLARFPFSRRLLGLLRIIPRKQAEIPWPDDVLCVNVKKGLPFPDHSFTAVYSSHLLEHLYRQECLKLLRECLRVLKSGGICRAVAPDLESLVQEYVKSKEGRQHSFGDPARTFIRSLHLTNEAPLPGSIFYRWYQRLTGFHTHKWMYDKESLVLLFQGGGVLPCGAEKFSGK